MGTIKRHTIHRINRALYRGNTKPLRRFLNARQKSGKEPFLWDNEVALLQSTLSSLLDLQLVEEATQLLQLLGPELFTEFAGSSVEIAVQLVALADEAFIEEFFSKIPHTPFPGGADTDEGQLYAAAARTALQHNKEAAAASIYKAAFARSASMDFTGESPLLTAARSGNRSMAQAFRDHCFQARHFPSCDSSLHELITLDDPFYVQLALDCGLNPEAPVAQTGESLLSLAKSEKMTALLLKNGVTPTDPQVFLLRQAMLSLQNGTDSIEHVQKILTYLKPLISYSFHENTRDRETLQTWDLRLEAAKYKNASVLALLLPYLRDDQLLVKMLDLLFGVDIFADNNTAGASAEAVLSVLELFADNDIRLSDPWDWDEEFVHIAAPYHSKVAKILDLACFSRHDASSYSDEQLTQAAKLLWKIGGLEDSPEGARELLLLGLKRRKMFLLEYCLSTGKDFSLLDTDKTTAAWNVLATNTHEDQHITTAYLQMVLENGGEINHQTGTGDTALHEVYRYRGNAPDFAAELLLAAGADPTIRNNEGLLPEDVPQETYEITVDDFPFFW